MYATSVTQIAPRPRGLAALKARALAGDAAARDRLREIGRMGAAAAAARGTAHRWNSDEAYLAGKASGAARSRLKIVA